MKYNNRFQKDDILPLNLKMCACGGLIHPHNQIKINASEIIVTQGDLYSKKGFIKGLSALDKIKNLKYGFSTKQFGNMGFKYGSAPEVTKNRRKFIQAVGSKLKNSVFMKPNHKTNIEIIESKDKGRGAFKLDDAVNAADGMITFEKGVALGINSADCVPLIITNKEASFLALVHAGRTGTDAQITKTMVKKLVSLGINPADLVIGIGPSIQKSCYKFEYLETGKPNQWLPWVAPYFKNSQIVIEKAGKKFRIKAQRGKILIDVIGFNIHQLIKSGVLAENIQAVPLCSYCESKENKLFSNYLTNQFKSLSIFPEGRFMTLAMLS